MCQYALIRKSRVNPIGLAFARLAQLLPRPLNSSRLDQRQPIPLSTPYAASLPARSGQ